MKCMTRDLKDRYADVGALAEALRPFAANKSIHRIDAAHEALATPTPHVDESMPPPPNGDDEKKKISLAATVQVGQGGSARPQSKATKTPSDPDVSVAIAP